MTVLINPDKFRMRAVGSLRFVDASNLAPVTASLDAIMVDQAERSIVHRLEPRGAGHWVPNRVTGAPVFLPPLALRTIADRQPVDPTTIGQFPPEWVGRARDFEVRVEDEQGRFLPTRFDFRMPDPAETIWSVWGSPPIARIRSLLLPGETEADYIPLFNRSGRTYDVPVGRVGAHLAIRQADGTDRPASWALLRVRQGNTTIGLGLADQNGNAEVAFSYPELPILSPADAAAGRDRITWRIRISVHFDDLASETTSDGQILPPKFEDILAQLPGPATRALRNIDDNTPFPATDLVLGERLILRTLDGSDQPLSSLFLEAS
ncbi:MAG: hypothetical protein QNJ15_04590 [Erythrobacter sp.]|nr:hypothetical protein [Erythrobacter sp.]